MLPQPRVNDTDRGSAREGKRRIRRREVGDRKRSESRSKCRRRSSLWPTRTNDLQCSRGINLRTRTHAETASSGLLSALCPLLVPTTGCRVEQRMYR